MHTTFNETTAARPVSPLADLLTLEEQQQRCERVFPSMESLRWFIRQHRAMLEDSGALLYINGRQRVDAARFDECVLQAGRLAAQRRRGA